MTHEEIQIGSIEMVWDEDARLATLRFTKESHATGEEAVTLVEALTQWIGSEGRPFGLLGDGERLKGVDAEYRSKWGSFLKQHSECYVALFNMNAVVRIVAEMFRIGTGMHLKTFARESEARLWLRRNGIPA